MEILRYHRTIFHACQPGGQLNKVWWYMSSLQTFDFLLAAMVICLELNHLQSTVKSSEYSFEIFDLLQNTHDIWANHPNRFRDAVRGAGILKAMLRKCLPEDHPQQLLQDPVPAVHGPSMLDTEELSTQADNNNRELYSFRETDTRILLRRTSASYLG